MSYNHKKRKIRVKMAGEQNLGSTKRYGTRYGPRNKQKVAVIESECRGRHKCPFCNYTQVKRLSRGIWQCGKCNAKFAGKAYTFSAVKKEQLVAEEAEAE